MDLLHADCVGLQITPLHREYQYVQWLSIRFVVVGCPVIEHYTVSLCLCANVCMCVSLYVFVCVYCVLVCVCVSVQYVLVCAFVCSCVSFFVCGCILCATVILRLM